MSLGVALSSSQRFILKGSYRFCLASLAVFATVAFVERWMYDNLTLLGAYLVWTILFVALGSLALRPLVTGPVSTARFYGVFGAGFFAYAAGWVFAYFLFRGTTGEWVGSLAGSVLLVLVIAGAFKSWRSVPFLSLMLFALHSVGYFLGSILHSSLGGRIGMLLWGVAYGAFFGAGLGFVLYSAQRRLGIEN
jgi:hypothetical protein